MDMQQLFEEICDNALTREQAAHTLFIIAKALLQKGFTPKLDKLQSASLRRGAYLVDFYSSFYPISDTRKKQIRKQLNSVRQQLPSQTLRVPFYLDDKPGFDEVAEFWGLSNGIRPVQVSGLLDLQRRANL